MAAAAAAAEADPKIQITVRPGPNMTFKKDLSATKVASTTVAALTTSLTKDIKEGKLFVFVTVDAGPASTRATSGTHFVPSPDQTLGDLARLYGPTQSALILTVSKAIFFG